jgi:hypothetical protein
MITREKASDYTGDKNRIKTDWPLCEKDEQGEAIEQMRKYQNQVVEIWRSMIKKRADFDAGYIDS